MHIQTGPAQPRKSNPTYAVGYHQVTLQPGYNMMSVNFKAVSDDDGIDINDLFPGGGKSDTVFTYGASSGKGDLIQVYVNDGNEGGEYTDYFLFKKSPGKSDKDYYWCNAADGSLANRKFKNGEMFWFYKRGDKAVTATVSGAVDVSTDKVIHLQKGYNFIGNYFPTGWTLNNDTQYTTEYWKTCGAVFGASSGKGDLIQVWVNDGKGDGDYVDYYLYKKSPGTSAKDYTWVSASDGSTYTGAVLQPGQGAWYYHRGNGYDLKIENQTGLAK